MQELVNRVAVVTGAASGIGLALGHAFAEAGAHVVLLDRDRSALDTAVAAVAASGPAPDRTPLGFVVDVRDRGQLEDVRDQVTAHHGAVDVLCNNAGIGGRMGPMWELTDDDWDEVVGVNLRGVVNGIATFVPGMVERGRGHVVNTASMAGLLPMPFGSPYVATKHAVVGLTATLRWELLQSAPGLSASVLCPGWVQTNIAAAQGGGVLDGHDEGPAGVMARQLADNVGAGMSPRDVAARVLQAVRGDEFWILTHADQAAHVLPHYADAVRSSGLEAEGRQRT